MSAILRWFHDGDVRYRAYFNTLAPEEPRQLIIASKTGDAIDIVLHEDRQLEDFAESELISYARLLRPAMATRFEDAAAD